MGTMNAMKLHDTAAIRVWIVDDDESIRWVLEKSLSRDGMLVDSFPGAAELLDALQDATAETLPDVMITDIRMPGLERPGAAGSRARGQARIAGDHHDRAFRPRRAVAAFKGGAFEYLPKPFDVDEAVASCAARAAEAGGTAGAEADGTARRDHRRAPAMQDVFRAIGRLSVPDDRADHRRVRHRQGARRAGAARHSRRVRTSRSSR
jgi:two-component system, NtrC family, nitrogen regulation response regulator GlnG